MKTPEELAEECMKEVCRAREFSDTLSVKGIIASTIRAALEQEQGRVEVLEEALKHVLDSDDSGTEWSRDIVVDALHGNQKETNERAN